MGSRQIHTFPPVSDGNSRVLILGTFPSVRSRQEGFYYGHPQNRFWRVAAAVFSDCIPQTRPEKEQLLLRHGIALWDVLSECDISGSDDASICGESPNDIAGLIHGSSITHIYLNGKKAYELYKKHIALPLPAIALPSTSPANAAYTLERLVEAWSVLRGLKVPQPPGRQV